jgi:DNA-binding HxlR family transcriptional regulator
VSIADWDRDNCAVGNTMAVIGERWTLLVLREAFLGVRRFEQIQRNTGVARNILSDRLNTLVANGILRREAYQERPVRYEYRLTEKGLDLYPVLITLMAWGMRHAMDDVEPTMLLQHKGCGSTSMPRLACPDCGEPVEAREMRALPGPGATLRASA